MHSDVLLFRFLISPTVYHRDDHGHDHHHFPHPHPPHPHGADDDDLPHHFDSHPHDDDDDDYDDDDDGLNKEGHLTRSNGRLEQIKRLEAAHHSITTITIISLTQPLTSSLSLIPPLSPIIKIIISAQ